MALGRGDVMWKQLFAPTGPKLVILHVVTALALSLIMPIKYLMRHEPKLPGSVNPSLCGREGTSEAIREYSLFTSGSTSEHFFRGGSGDECGELKQTLTPEGINAVVWQECSPRKDSMPAYSIRWRKGRGSVFTVCIPAYHPARSKQAKHLTIFILTLCI